MGLPGLWDYPRYTEFFLSLSISPSLPLPQYLSLPFHLRPVTHSCPFFPSLVRSFFLFTFSPISVASSCMPSSPGSRKKGRRERKKVSQNHLLTFYRMTKLLLHLLLLSPSTNPGSGSDFELQKEREEIVLIQPEILARVK